MHPVIVEIPLWGGRSLPLHSYGFMIVVGFLLAIWVTRREFLRRGLPDVAYDVGLTMLLCGLLGGRIFYYVQFYEQQFAGESFLEFFKIWKGGLVFYGGAIGGLVGACLLVFRRGLPLGDTFDALAAGTPAGMAFGRLGCFLNGCCYGGRCAPSFPLGVRFPPGSPAHRDQWAQGVLDALSEPALALHPTQLYQAAHDFLLLAILIWYVRRPESVRGGAMPLLFAIYGIGRFVLECLRGDQPPTSTGWTVGQNVSAVLFLASASLFVFLYVLSRKRVACG